METRPNKGPQISTVEYVHSRLSIHQGTRMLEAKHGEKIRLLDKDFEVLKVYVLNVGDILVPANFVQALGFQDDPVRLVATHRASLSRLRTKLAQVHAYDENFPDGFLLTIFGRGTTMVNPDLQSHINQFRPYSQRSSLMGKK